MTTPFKKKPKWQDFLDHALSLLFSNSPHLLRFFGPDDPYYQKNSLKSAHDKTLFSIASFLRGESKTIDIEEDIGQLNSIGIESIILSLEVILSYKLLEEKENPLDL